VSEGDYIHSIDGEELTGAVNPYRLLRSKTSDPITLLVSETGTAEDAREVSVQPISSESELVYLDMVLTNKQRVEEMTDGKIGYLHIPDMGSDGIREFNKWFYSQLRKDGLVIDVRSNGGGNVSQMIIERLRRNLLATGFQRGAEMATTYPRTMFHGHLVCILDEDSASDGDIFPAMFREAGLGPLIGKRSWGGVIGITNRGTLIDGGSVNVPEFGFASAAGKWIIEGYGVDPDIEVENDPKSLIDGKDPQLERAVDEVLAIIKKEPRKLPQRPKPPKKTK
jgi:tricorn protease